MANQPTYQKFTVESKKDPSSNTYSIASYDKDLRAFKEAVRSAMPKDSFFYFDEKDFGKQGKLTVDIYTHQEDASLVNKALKEKSSQLLYKGSLDEKYRAVKHRVDLTPEEIERVSKIEAIPVNKQQEQEEKQARKEAEKESRDRMGAMLKLFGLVTVLTDITRRILTSVLDFSKGTLEAGRNARNLGTSYAVAREASILETAHGLPQGTITGAMGDIQKMFGNITNLDESALGALALVMGSDIESLVKSGIGGDRPEELLGAILDSYMDRANKGYNSLGQYVGQEDARRELYSQLLKISPQIADLFATMQDERNNINSIYRSQFDTFEEWKRLMSTNRQGFTGADYGVVETLAETRNAIEAMVKQLKEGILISVASDRSEALKKIANWRIGMTEKERWQADEEAKKANRKYIEQIDTMLEAYPDTGKSVYDYYLTPEERASVAYRTVLLAEKEKAEKQLGKNKNIENVTRTLNELQVEANKVAQSGYQGAVYMTGHTGENRPYGVANMWEVINRFVPREVIEGLVLKEEGKALLETRAKEYKELLDKYTLEEKMDYGPAKARIAKERPDLFGLGTRKTKGKFGKTITESYQIEKWKTLTDEDKQNILAGIDFESEELANLIFDRLGWQYGLNASARRLGMDEIKEAVTNSPDFIQSLLLLTDLANTVGGKLNKGSYDIIGEKRGNTYHLFLDIKKDGKFEDRIDIPLFSAQGGDWLTGNTGLIYDAGSNTITKKNMQSTSASSEK